MNNLHVLKCLACMIVVTSTTIMPLVNQVSLHTSLALHTPSCAQKQEVQASACHFSRKLGIVGVCYSDELMDIIDQKIAADAYHFDKQELKLKVNRVVEAVMKVTPHAQSHDDLANKIVALYGEALVLLIQEFLPTISAITDDRGYYKHYQTPFAYTSQAERMNAQEKAGYILALAYAHLQPTLIDKSCEGHDALWNVIYSPSFKENVYNYVLENISHKGIDELSASGLTHEEKLQAITFIVDSRLNRIDEFKAEKTHPEMTKLQNGLH